MCRLFVRIGHTIRIFEFKTFKEAKHYGKQLELEGHKPMCISKGCKTYQWIYAKK